MVSYRMIPAVCQFGGTIAGTHLSCQGFAAVAQPRPKGNPVSELSHIDTRGKARMVDVGEKPDTMREARARGAVVMQPACWRWRKSPALWPPSAPPS
jgi:hypothetical protein